MDLVAVRTQALLPVIGVHLRGSVGAVRSCTIARSDGRVPAPARCGGRRDDPVVAGDTHGDLSAPGAADGHGGLGHGIDGCADPGADSGWLDYRQLELAVEFLHQPAARRARVFYGVGFRSRSAVHEGTARARRPR